MNDVMNPTTAQFARDVEAGLSADPKYLSSRYFYDAQGDAIFQQIMNMPEYYPTPCEYEILNRQKKDILEAIHPGRPFKLVELGAGDGYKTKLLLEHMVAQNVDFEYLPVDISDNVLKLLEDDLREQLPQLKVKPLHYEYFSALHHLNELDEAPKVILFVGGNIGNFDQAAARQFLDKLHEAMRPGDLLLSGIDLKKNPRTILQAYNDPAGITRSFNLNLLERINRELGGNFKIQNFDHFPSYDPLTGECRSYLMSTVNQEVHIEWLEKSFHFHHSEPVHMEISRKYSLPEIEQLARKSNFEVVQHFTDSREYFVDTLWRKI